MCISFLSGAPFVATNNATARAMIRLARIKKNMRVYDLGSGNGKLLLRAKKTDAKVLGYEINPFLVLVSRLRGAPTKWQNFWHAHISDADCIFIYLLPSKMEKLAAKLKKECKKGTIIVSNSFIFPNWKIARQDVKNHVYVFEI